MKKSPGPADGSFEVSVFDALSFGVVVLNQKGEIMVWNAWMDQHSHLLETDVLGSRFFELFPDIGRRLKKSVQDALGKKLSSMLSTRLHPVQLPLYSDSVARQRNDPLRQSISIRPLNVHGSTCCLLQIHDASQSSEKELMLKQTALELEMLATRAREQEFQLQTILNNTLDAVIVLNRLGRISGFYQSAQRMFGYTEYELLGKPLSQLFQAGYGRRTELMLRAGQSGESIAQHEELTAVTAAGETFDADVAVNTIFEVDNLQFIVTIKDITQRKQAEEALYQEKEQAQVTLSSIADGVITTDIIGRINFINPAALKLTGYSHEELFDQPIDRVITVQSERAVLPVFECIETGQQVDSVSGDTLIARDGQQMIIHQVATPIHNRSGHIIGAVMIFRDMSKSHRLASRLSWQASHDELTQLFNRREFERQLANVLHSARSEGAEHCLCFMDLDKFKVVNDTCGHVAGDELLRQLADIFRHKIRGADTLARLGGDEFAVILNRCGLGPAVNVAEELRGAIEDFRFGWGDQSFQIGVSIGLVLIDQDSPDMDEIFKAADSACYAAKEAGRNRVHIYSPDDVEISQRRGEAQWMVRIQSALETNRFQLTFQPIVPLLRGPGDPVHYEILLRMIGDDGELIPPGAFLGAAERYQIMARIDLWVIESLFRWTNEYWDFSAPEIFAINLSGQSLANPTVLDSVKRLFQQYPVPANRVCFEITETAAISNLSQAQQFMADLGQLGCRFALDDFGSGLSSFAYLKTLKVDYLKIDGAFVKDMASDPIDRAMVESIHKIGSVLNLKTIAEFVENDEILECLIQMGVDYAQGYGIAEPRPLPDDGSQLFKAPAILS
jgi:Amt family ammonium transporter